MHFKMLSAICLNLNQSKVLSSGNGLRVEEKLLIGESLFISGCAAIDSLRFIVLGDWGGLPTWPYETLVEKSVAMQMAKVTDKYGSKFNLALGDNFYFDGVTDVNDKRFYVRI